MYPSSLNSYVSLHATTIHHSDLPLTMKLNWLGILRSISLIKFSSLRFQGLFSKLVHPMRSRSSSKLHLPLGVGGTTGMTAFIETWTLTAPLSALVFAASAIALLYLSLFLFVPSFLSTQERTLSVTNLDHTTQISLLSP